MNKREGFLYELMSTVANGGQSMSEYVVQCLFNLLNASSVSTRITASVLSCSKISLVACMTASPPPFKPVDTCSGPPASCMSSDSASSSSHDFPNFYWSYLSFRPENLLSGISMQYIVRVGLDQ